jgi:hypothetical protein
MLLFYLQFGVSGFLLLIILLSMVFVTLAQDDTIVIIDTQDQDIVTVLVETDMSYRNEMK